MRRKRAEDAVPATPGGGRVTPAEVQQVEFRLSFRGYNERDVDAFLDRITEDLSAYLEELERVRGGAPVAPPTAGNGTAEGDAMIARAREQAATIVRQAEQQAAAITASAGASGDARSAVAPFLNTEREFLQSLGGLVQGHAEEIKRMVLALRSREGASTPAAPTPASRAVAEPTASGNLSSAPPPPAPASETGASASEIRERLGEPEPTPARPASELDEPIVLEGSTEPAFSSEGAPAGEGRERSLRELFWGED